MGGSYRPLQPLVLACRTCRAPMFWAKVASTGKNIPIDAAAREDGNIVLIDHRTCTVLGPDEAAEIPGRKYQSHFVSCPDAKAWRRARGIPDSPPVTREEPPCPSPSKS